MNAIYKVIWNDAIRQYQVVNELCRSRRKACSVKAVHTERTSDSATSSLKIGAALLKPQHTPLQDSNDNFLANIQKDGTYSVIPRSAGGEITPEGIMP